MTYDPKYGPPSVRIYNETSHPVARDDNPVQSVQVFVYYKECPNVGYYDFGVDMWFFESDYLPPIDLRRTPDAKLNWMYIPDELKEK